MVHPTEITMSTKTIEDICQGALNNFLMANNMVKEGYEAIFEMPVANETFTLPIKLWMKEIPEERVVCTVL